MVEKFHILRRLAHSGTFVAPQTREQSRLNPLFQQLAVYPRAEILLLILALGMRLIGVQSRPLWYDEAFAVLFAEKGLAAMLEGTLSPAAENLSTSAADVHPLLYYSLLNGWMKIFGSSPGSARALSILFGIVSIVALYALITLMLGRRIGLVAGFFSAIAPFQVHYSQEVRMYALVGLLVIGAGWAMQQAMQKGRLRFWILFSVLAALAQYTHSLAVVHLAALAATALFTRQKRHILGVFFAGMGSLLLYLPWLLRLPSQLARVGAGYWTEKPGADRLVTTLLTYVTNLPLQGVWLFVGLFAAVLVFAVAAWQTVQSAVQSRWDGSARRGVWLAWMALSPVLALFVVSQWQPVYIERALLPSGAFFLGWLAWSLLSTKMPALVRGFSSLALLLGMAIGLASHWQYQGFPYADFPHLGRLLQNRQQVGDTILHSNKLSAIPMIYYAPDLPQHYLPDPPGNGADTLARSTQRVLGYLAEESILSATAQSNRVWFIIFKQAIEEYRQAGYTTHPDLEWLEQHFILKNRESYSDLQIFLYER